MAEKVFVHVPTILLPKPEFRKAWPVVACDQFTSEPEYWDAVKKEVGDKPSMLNLILPELYLDSPKEKDMIENIVKSMQEYLAKGIFTESTSCVYVERKTRKTPRRRGVIMALDLEAYNFNSESKPSPIRPTEMTVVERIPPRLRVRSRAVIESPHILILIDDPERKIIEPLTEERVSFEKLYDEELMLNAGHITGYKVPPSHVERIVKGLEVLGDAEAFEKKYGVGKGTPPLLFAVGDGNHSLATAKQSWEDIKAKGGKEKEAELMKTHPARYCMVEISNIFDEGIEFEAIHRVLFNTKTCPCKALKEKYGEEGVSVEKFESFSLLKGEVEKRAVPAAAAGGKHYVGLVTSDQFLLLGVPASPSSVLPVGTIQEFLDSEGYKKEYGKIDYIHGDDVVVRLIKEDEKKETFGIILPTLPKSLLFPTVIRNNRLPRKTFSMGEADEKRFYFECRKIIP